MIPYIRFIITRVHKRLHTALEEITAFMKLIVTPGKEPFNWGLGTLVKDLSQMVTKALTMVAVEMERGISEENLPRFGF